MDYLGRFICRLGFWNFDSQCGSAVELFFENKNSDVISGAYPEIFLGEVQNTWGVPDTRRVARQIPPLTKNSSIS